MRVVEFVAVTFGSRRSVRRTWGRRAGRERRVDRSRRAKISIHSLAFCAPPRVTTADGITIVVAVVAIIISVVVVAVVISSITTTTSAAGVVRVRRILTATAIGRLILLLLIIIVLVPTTCCHRWRCL